MKTRQHHSRSYFAGILMDSLVFYYNLKKFKASGLDLQQETDVKNSDTSIGMMFASQSFAKWANFVNQFFIENKDAEDRIIKDAVLEMKTRVSDEQELSCPVLVSYFSYFIIQ